MTSKLSLSARRLLAPWVTPEKPQVDSEPEFSRRTCPDASMTLLLRFESEQGPRTIVAPRIPLKTASAVAQAMLGAGHYAELVDEGPSLTVAEQVVRRNCLAGPKPQGAGVLALPRRSA